MKQLIDIIQEAKHSFRIFDESKHSFRIKSHLKKKEFSYSMYKFKYGSYNDPEVLVESLDDLMQFLDLPKMYTKAYKDDYLKTRDIDKAKEEFENGEIALIKPLNPSWNMSSYISIRYTNLNEVKKNYKELQTKLTDIDDFNFEFMTNIKE